MTSPKFLFAAALAASLAAWAAPAAAQQDKVIGDGRYEYQGQCQTCHGLLGKGDGTVADILIVAPPDLTQIAKRNGGTFPFWTVYDIIAGDKPVRAHQFSGMPLWGQRFRAEEEAGVAAPADIRMLLLTHYLESIQEK
jgi:mono/diheme cytochrome c family protein